jgi:hypothetical protein
VPNPINPQAYNRFSYVRNSPINFNDPTGHCEAKPSILLDDQQAVTQNCGGYTIVNTGGIGGTGGWTGSDDEDNNDPGSVGGGISLSGYSGPIHSDVLLILESQGADPDLLNSVTIHVETKSSDKYCKDNNKVAVTSNSDIFVCKLVANNGDIIYDPTQPTPVFLHELIHVKQFREKWASTWIEVFVSDIKDKVLTNYNPYKNSWMEMEGSDCQKAFNANPGMALDSTGVCDLSK